MYLFAIGEQVVQLLEQVREEIIKDNIALKVIVLYKELTFFGKTRNTFAFLCMIFNLQCLGRVLDGHRCFGRWNHGSRLGCCGHQSLPIAHERRTGTPRIANRPRKVVFSHFRNLNLQPHRPGSNIAWRRACRHGGNARYADWSTCGISGKRRVGFSRKNGWSKTELSTK